MNNTVGRASRRYIEWEAQHQHRRTEGGTVSMGWYVGGGGGGLHEEQGGRGDRWQG